MTNSISFTAHVAGARKTNSQMALSPNGNPYKKTNVCGKIGALAGTIGAIAYLGVGGGEEYLCNGLKWADKLFKNTKLAQCGTTGKFIAILAVSSGIIGLTTALGKGLFGIFDKKANHERAQRADELAQQ